MSDKFLLIFGSILMAIGLIGLNLEESGVKLLSHQNINFAFSGGQVMLIFLLLVNGSFIQKNWQRKSLFLFVNIFIIGILFKILHWEGASTLLYISLLGPILVYTPHFFLKKPKGYVDILKFLWALSFFPGTLGKLLHLPYTNEFLWSSYLLLIILSIDFWIKFFGKKENRD